MTQCVPSPAGVLTAEGQCWCAVAVLGSATTVQQQPHTQRHDWGQGESSPDGTTLFFKSAYIVPAMENYITQKSNSTWSGLWFLCDFPLGVGAVKSLTSTFFVCLFDACPRLYLGVQQQKSKQDSAWPHLPWQGWTPFGTAVPSAFL